ncbi:MAG TPA: peptidylprolyl isomerase [Planctomycetota bacterium]|nr:peptidylprolyl isomerase [Planctomycetota bacterium]
MKRLLYVSLLLAAALARAGDDKNYTPEIKALSVNGQTLPAEKIRAKYDLFTKIYRVQEVSDLSKRKLLLDKLAEKAREYALIDEAVRQHIEKNKLTLSADELKEDMEAYKADEEAKWLKEKKEPKTFEEILKARGKTEEQVATEMTPRFIMQRWLMKEYEKNPEPVKKAWEEAKLKEPLRRASQILLSYDKAKYTTSNRTKDDAQKQAAYALERAKKGEDFAALAKELSDDRRTKEQGGDLGFLAATPTPPTSPPKQVLDALYALQKPGDVSDVVESEMGFHILKMTDQVPDDTAFKKFLHTEIYHQAINAEVKLMKDAKVEEVK